MKIKTLTLCISSAIAIAALPVSAAEIIKATMSQAEFNSIYVSQTKISGAAQDAGLVGTGWATLYDDDLEYNRAPRLIPDRFIVDSDAVHGGTFHHDINAISAKDGVLTLVALKAIFNVPYSVSANTTTFGTPVRTDIKGDLAFRAQVLDSNLILVHESNKTGKLGWPISVEDFRAANPDKWNVGKQSIEQQADAVCRLYNSETSQSKTIPASSCAYLGDGVSSTVLAVGSTFDNTKIGGYEFISTGEIVLNEITIDKYSTALTDSTRSSRVLLTDIVPELKSLNRHDRHATLSTDNLGGVYLIASAHKDQNTTSSEIVTFVYKTDDGINWSNVTDKMYDTVQDSMRDNNWRVSPRNGRENVPVKTGLNTYDYVIHPDNLNLMIHNNTNGTSGFDSQPYLTMRASNQSELETMMMMDNMKLVTDNSGLSWNFDTRFYNFRALESGLLDVGNGYLLPYSNDAYSGSGFAFAPYGGEAEKWYDYAAIGSFELMAYDPATGVIFTGARAEELNGETTHTVHAMPLSLLNEFYTWPMNSDSPTPTPTPTPESVPSTSPSDSNDSAVKSGGGGGSFGFISLLVIGLLSLTRARK